MIAVLLLLGGIVCAGLATNFAEGRAQRTAVVSLGLLLTGLILYAVYASEGAS